MPITRELLVSYGGVTFGGSTARQIDGYSSVEKDYTTAAFEFSFITSATSEAGFAAECLAVENAFRVPRQDLIVTQGAATLLTLKQSNNTGFDANPTILKQGDIADTGRSRFYHVRIEFGLPADNLALGFRRFSTINVDYSPERQRTVTISGTYTANSTDGVTGSFATYLANAPAYFTSVLTGISATSSWDKTGEPQVERNETDKITNFSATFKEIIFNQSVSSVDDPDLVDPTLVINVQNTAPGDSFGTSISFGGSGIGGTTSPGVNSGSDATVAGVPPSNPGSTGTGPQRPIVITVNYTTGIDNTTVGGLAGIKTKWTAAIRPLLIQQVQNVVGSAVVLIEDTPNYGDLYAFKFSAVMIFHSYVSNILSQRITVSDSTSEGKKLRHIWDGDPYSYYEYTAGKIRTKTLTEEREEVTNLTDVNAYVESQVKDSPVPSGLANSSNWTVLTREPKGATLRRGLSGGQQVFIGEIRIVTVMQYRKKRGPSVASVGGLSSNVAGAPVATG